MANTHPYIARVSAGDALYIPDGWWHVVRSLAGRNIAIALEVAPYKAEQSVWSQEMITMRNAPGLYWAEQVRISAAMREEHAERIPSRTHNRPIRCDAPLAEPPSSLEACAWLGEEPHF